MVVRDLSFGIGAHTRSLVKHLKLLGVEVDVHVGGSNWKTNMSVKNLKPCYDVIHVQGSPFGAFKSKGVNRNTPRVVTVHTLLKNEWMHEKKLSYFLGQPFEQRTLRLANKIILVNESLLPELRRYGLGLEEKSVVVHNGVDPNEFGAPYFGSRENYVLSCGRNVKRKGFDTLKKACRKAGVPYQIFHGELSRSELIEHFKKAKMFVCASQYEGLPTTVMEAMICGCPVISTGIPCMNGLVVDGVTGLLFRFGDVEDLARRISYLMVNEDLARKIAYCGYEHVYRNYNFKDLAKETLKVYEEVVG